eukprot:TRINITY_DN11226_c0_g1_i1.p1 TRINITY_DN11226_c0_g1~~TRINITY_DN11226_c0_g1_i1.p1  ORF type:complete len:440 (-),score=59.38 TRINITY_DN11226_c0_g1_i1:94-1380(-)
MAETSTNALLPVQDFGMWTPHAKSRSSYYSSTNQEKISYKGLLNLALLILFLANFRLIMENFFRYGFLVEYNFGPSIIGDPYAWPGVTILLSLNGYIIVAFLIEKIFPRSRTGALCFHAVNLLTLITLPWYLATVHKPSFAPTLIVSISVSVLFLKLYSFAHVCYLLKAVVKESDLRSDDKDVKSVATRFVNAKSLSYMYYFTSLPTLCFQIEYPVPERPFQKRMLAKRIVAFAVFSFITYAIGHQYTYPAIKNSVIHIDSADYPKLVERVLKTAVPNLYCWLLGFFVFFEVYLNILADITGFADRRFYSDWWNAKTLGYYWRTWNFPVHSWIKRHVYHPVEALGLGKNWAAFASFFVSAFFHEYILSMPFGQVKLWAFFGILIQLPAVYLTRPLKHYHYAGNILFWISIVVGQPFIAMLYYRAYLAF